MQCKIAPRPASLDAAGEMTMAWSQSPPRPPPPPQHLNNTSSSFPCNQTATSVDACSLWSGHVWLNSNNTNNNHQNHVRELPDRVSVSSDCSGISSPGRVSVSSDCSDISSADDVSMSDYTDDSDATASDGSLSLHPPLGRKITIAHLPPPCLREDQNNNIEQDNNNNNKVGVEGINKNAWKKKSGKKSDNPSRERLLDDEGYIRRAACVCLDETESKVLLVSSKRDPCSWLVPGGGMEAGEEMATAAIREAWEEAGVQGHITKYLGQFETNHESGSKKHRTNVFVVSVKQVMADYPEAYLGRGRQWFTLEDALLHLARTRPHQSDYLQLLLVSRLRVTNP